MAKRRQSMTPQGSFLMMQRLVLGAPIMTMLILIIRSCSVHCQSVDNSTTSVDGKDDDVVCWKNLTELHLLQLNKSKFESVVYNLCPNTVYNIGVEDETTGIVMDPELNQPLDLASNTKYMCGPDGNPLNNCTLVGGDWQIFSLGIAFGGVPTTNAVIQGVTFQAAVNNAAYLGNAGDVTFIDCIFKNHENYSPIAAGYIPVTRRRQMLTREGQGTGNIIISNKDQKFKKRSSASYIREIMVGHTYVDTTTSVEGEVSNRRIQTNTIDGSDDEYTRMSVTFTNCTFYNNSIGPNVPQSVAGIIRVYFQFTDLIVNNSTFLSNDFVDPIVDPQGFAIRVDEGSTITLEGNCFVKNKFVGLGTVQLNGTSIISIKDNYADDGGGQLECNFVSNIQENTETNVSVCIDPDLTSCPRDIPDVPTFPPAPIQSPTQTPMSAPAVLVAPTNNDTGSSGCTGTCINVMLGIWFQLPLAFIIIVIGLS